LKNPVKAPENRDFLREMEGRKSPFSAIWNFSQNRLNYGNQAIKHTSRKTASREPGAITRQSASPCQVRFHAQLKKIKYFS
jgi:hypothetical protein